MKNRLKKILLCGIMLLTLLPLTTLASAFGTDNEPVTNGIFDHTIIRGFALCLGRDLSGKTTH
ncbi:MAG: hypothetical protein JW840_05140, partial [Candidatus Thermoplasmatota archaeon]|nr:hypothetical protein [Candidatus Thermoplasmatota archaeon]